MRKMVRFGSKKNQFSGLIDLYELTLQVFLSLTTAVFLYSITVTDPNRKKRKAFCKLMASNYYWFYRAVYNMAHPVFPQAKHPNLNTFLQAKDPTELIRDIVMTHYNRLENNELAVETICETLSPNYHKLLDIAQTRLPTSLETKHLIDDIIKRFDYWNEKLTESLKTERIHDPELYY